MATPASAEALETRRLLTGQLDTTWGAAGVAAGNFSVPDDVRQIATVAGSSNTIVQLGWSYPYPQVSSSAKISRYTSSGVLDKTFGSGGVVTLASIQPDAVAVQPDGKVLISAAIRDPSDGVAVPQMFDLVRLNLDGSLDTTFGNGGDVRVAVSNGADTSTAISFSSTGQIIVAGDSSQVAVGSNPPVDEFSIARFNRDGTLDTTFGNGNGFVSSPYPVGQPSYVSPVAVTADPFNRIVISGLYNTDPSSGSTSGYTAFLSRFNADGTVDTTFNGTGFVNAFSQSALSPLPVVAVGSDGQIDLTRSSPGDISILQYTPSGLLDPEFGNVAGAPGQTTISLGSGTTGGTLSGVLVGLGSLSSGEIVAAGSASGAGAVFSARISGAGIVQSVSPPLQSYPVSGAFVGSDGSTNFGGSTIDSIGLPAPCVVRLTATGSLDPKFGNAGSVVSDLRSSTSFSVNSKELLSDGKLLVGGNITISGSYSAFAVARINADGFLDTSFGDNGLALTRFSAYDFNHWQDILSGLAVQPDGEIVAVGDRQSPTGERILAQAVRYHANGTLDTSFGTNGLVILPTVIGQYSGNLQNVEIQPNGGIVIAGQVYSYPVDSTFVIRLNPDGSRDTTFNNNTSLYSMASSSGWTSLAVDSTGNILLGTNQLTRLLPDGRIDSSFHYGSGQLAQVNGFDEIHSIVIRPGGKILLGGTGWYVNLGESNTTAIAELLPNGDLDSSFNGTGILRGGGNNIGSSVYAISVLANGDLLAGVGPIDVSLTSQAIRLWALLPDGSFDGSFGTNGTATTDSTVFERGRTVGGSEIQVRPNGNILVVGVHPNYAPGPSTLARQYVGFAPTYGTVTGLVSLNSGVLPGETIYLDSNNNAKLDAGELTTTTGSDGRYTFSNVPLGIYAIRQILLPGVIQNSPANGAGIPIVFAVASQLTGANFIDALIVAPPAPLKGTLIGTTGSYKNGGNTSAKAFDGNLATYFDGPSANGNWIGLDLGSPKIVTSLAYTSRSGWASRMNGGIFQASNSATFASAVVNLYTIASNANPSAASLTTQTISNTNSYRYVRYLAPANSYGDVAEIQFFGKAPVTATLTKLTGTNIGTSGSYGTSGNTIAKATDGNLSTFFDGPTANGNWVGLDLGSAKVIKQINYAPRSGFASRMIGGIFQVSNSANFSSGVVNLYTITAAPTQNVLSNVTINVTAGYRYVRYLSPNGSYGDIAELAFYG